MHLIIKIQASGGSFLFVDDKKKHMLLDVLLCHKLSWFLCLYILITGAEKKDLKIIYAVATFVCTLLLMSDNIANDNTMYKSEVIL